MILLIKVNFKGRGSEKMYHEHPLRILKYSAKNIWLLIFPLLRGIRAFTLDVNKLYMWLKGAWFDIAVLGAILLFGFVRWYFSRISVTETEIIHTDGVFAKIKTAIPYEKISSITIEQTFYLRPFGGMRVSFDTCAGLFNATDMKMMISKKVCNLVMNKIPNIDVKSGVNYQHKPKIISVLLFSVFFSSSFSGAVYVAAFFFKSGDIAKDLITVSLDRITEETSKISKILIINIPAAAVGIGLIFLFTWLLSFIMNMLRYSGFSLKSDMKQIEIVCGMITKRTYRINMNQVNYTDLRQNLIMKLFKAVTVNISCAGYGSKNKHLPVILPIKKEDNFNRGIEQIGLCKGNKNEIRPGILSFWTYIWAPVITALAIYPVCGEVLKIFPRFAYLASFIRVMSEIPVIWLVTIKLVASATSRISIYDDKIMIRYSKWFDFHTVIAEHEKLVKIKIIQTPLQKISKRCNVSFYLNDEQVQRHYVKALKFKDVRKIMKLLDYDDALNTKI